MADGYTIDPFKHIGPSGSWGRFGEGEHDLASDAERRAMCDYLARRFAKAAKRHDRTDVFVPSLISGGLVAFVGALLSSMENEPTEEDFERWIGIATFAWYQALSISIGSGAVQ